MTKLSVNVNKIATLRNARGGDLPNLLDHVLAIESYGAHGITVHPRPDRRHIRPEDVLSIKKKITVELNVEGYPSAEFIALMNEVRPAQITLVPDPPHVLTSLTGFLLEKHCAFLAEVLKDLRNTGARISVFIDPFDYRGKGLEQLKRIGVDRIELFTGPYAQYFGSLRQKEVTAAYQEVANNAHSAGLLVNAGHDLSLQNLGYFLQTVPGIAEVSIGHALICDALIYGMESTVHKYVELIS